MKQKQNIMKTLKDMLLNDGEVYINDEHIMECFYHNFSHGSKYCIEFNGELHTYKSANGFLTKRKYFIDKYNLEYQNARYIH